MELDKKLYEEIKQYCDLNGMNTRTYIHDLLKKAFMEEKYGKMPPITKKKKTTAAPQPEPHVEVINVTGDDVNHTVTLQTVEEKNVSIEKTDAVSEKETVYLQKPKKRKL